MTERTLPPAVLDMHVGILGKTGSGKSNLAKATVEHLLDEGARVCVIDPTGTWYGLRLTRERKPSPYQVVMFGGNHADIAIGRTHGAAVAETIGTSTTPAVIDTRTMTVGERTEFFTGFAETLLQRNQGPLHLVIDEAHLFAPQGRVADPKSGQMLHAANNLVSLGRGVGLRIILISQRPAKLHKDSLTQIETLVAMRLIAPQDRRAIEDWIGEWADPKQGGELVASLPSLRTGELWIWSPEIGMLERRMAPLARTLDTGKPSSDPIELGTIDVATVQEKLGQIAADVVANDPKRLKARIRELEIQTELQAKAIASKPAAEPEVRVERVEVPVLNGQVPALREAVSQLAVFGSQLVEIASSITAAIGRVQTVPATTRREEGRTMGAAVTATAEPRAMPRGPVAPASVSTFNKDGGAPLGKAERSILAALTQYPNGKPQRSLGVLTGYAWSGGGFNNAISSLRSKGLIAGTRDHLTITDAGRETAYAIGVEDLPTGAALYQHWMSQLGKAERLILEHLVRVYPEAVTREELGLATNYTPTGGGFNNALSRLRTLELIERGELRASADLFDA